MSAASVDAVSLRLAAFAALAESSLHTAVRLGNLQQQCGLAQHPIVAAAHDDAPAYWPGSDLPAGVKPDTLAQPPCAITAQAVPIRPQQGHRLLQVPVRQDEASPQAQPGSCVRRPCIRGAFFLCGP